MVKKHGAACQNGKSLLIRLVHGLRTTNLMDLSVEKINSNPAKELQVIFMAFSDLSRF